MRFLVVAALTVGVSGLTSSCTSARSPCAGQCPTSFELDVTFTPGTTVATALAAVKACAQDPEVVSYDAPMEDSAGNVTSIIHTRNLGRSDKTSALLTCLGASPHVKSWLWPA